MICFYTGIILVIVLFVIYYLCKRFVLHVRDYIRQARVLAQVDATNVKEKALYMKDNEKKKWLWWFVSVALLTLLFMLFVTKCLPDDPPVVTPTITKEVTVEPTRTATRVQVSPSPTEVVTEVVPSNTPTATLIVVTDDVKTPVPNFPTRTLVPYEAEFDRCLCHQDAICICGIYKDDNHP